MGSWDTQHRLRLRAERALAALQEIWGDALPPGPNPELAALIDAIASDDAHGHQDHLICQDDGLTEQALARLWLQARHAVIEPPTPAEHATSTPDPVPVPHGLLTRLRERGLIDVDMYADVSADRAGEQRPKEDPLGHNLADGNLPADDLPDLSSATAAHRRSLLATAAGPSASPPPRHRPEPDQPSPLTGVWELDPATGTVAFDAVAAHLIGAGSETGNAAVQDHLQRLIHPDDRDQIASRMQQSLDTGQPYVMRFRTRSPEGKITWLLSQGRVLHNPADSSARLTGFITLDRDPHPGRDVEPSADVRH